MARVTGGATASAYGMRVLREALGSLRQLLFPSAFRIPRPQGEATLLEEADWLLQDLSRRTTQKAGVDEGHVEEELLVRVATGLWRLKQRMVDPSTGQSKDDMKRAFRHVESLWDTLGEFGVTVQDHTGECFNSGMALTVLSYEPDPALTTEVVKETVKPSVYFRERCIQRGEIIVGSPEA